MSLDLLSHSIVRYIIDERLAECEGEPARLPPLGELARQLGVSRGKLREDLIAAQAYGMVEMRPGDGTYVCPFDFYTAIRPLILYAIASDRGNFDRFYRLRARIEVAFWDDAVRQLGQPQLERLRGILAEADHKLDGTPIEIPHREHREFHVEIYSQIDNLFAQGLLKAYWDAYEAVGLHRYFELSYYQRVWDNHRQMVDHIAGGQYDEGKRVLLRHFTLLEDRLQGNGSQSASPPGAHD
ncbi:MAG: FadR family transcriptional regulator [Anaerolineae bacterium]|nr:FadR family transcriptional regulator [Anaerolineae bacterium]